MLKGIINLGMDLKNNSNLKKLLIKLRPFLSLIEFRHIISSEVYFRKIIMTCRKKIIEGKYLKKMFRSLKIIIGKRKVGRWVSIS